MTRLITIIGGKGGVGKTTLTSNLTTALTNLGQNVIAVDANLTTPNLGLHLGLPLTSKNLQDVLRGEAKIREATYSHPLGFSVMPASMNINDLKNVDVGRLPEVTLNLIGRADYVIMDCAAGLGREAVSAIEAATEVLIITNPDLPSVADALKTVRIAESQGKKIVGVVVNKVSGKWHELTRREIEEMLGAPVLVEIPEDKNVSKSIATKNPIVNRNPNSPASVEVRRLAHQLVGVPFKYSKPRSYRLLDRMVNWIIG
ncbi:MAG TPA: cell division ATPase MinD [archaeon]|nr:cell division ATPase MinD [archaeon]